MNGESPVESQSPEFCRVGRVSKTTKEIPAPTMGREPNPSSDLKTVAQEEANIPLWKDFGYFLIHNKKWWLLPIIVILVLLGLLTAISSTAIAPFIYSVF
jgi:hypothetical protein